jgi:hypothetical protein
VYPTPGGRLRRSSFFWVTTIVEPLLGSSVSVKGWQSKGVSCGVVSFTR